MDISQLLSNHMGWTIMGVRSGDKYIAFGTTEVWATNIQIEHAVQRYLDEFFVPQMSFRYERPRITVTLSFGTFTMASGDSYGEALAKLFGMWNPDQREGLPSPIQELNP